MEETRKPFRQMENALSSTTKRSGKKSVPAQGSVTPSPLRKSPRRKKARVSNAIGEEENSKMESDTPGSGSTASPHAIEFSPDSNSSEPALRLEDFDDDEEPPIKEGPENGKKTPGQLSTPPMSDLELNTRRNSLRPLFSDKKSRRQSTGSEESEGDKDGNTISLEAFQDILNAASDEESESKDHSGTNGASDSEKKDDGALGKQEKIEKQGSDEESDDDIDCDDSNRRNTASPSFLMKMLDMSDDEDQEELLEAATIKGQEEAKQLAASVSQSVFQSPVQSPKMVSPVASRTRGSASKIRPTPKPNKVTEQPPPSVTKRPMYNPTPLKSCISARKGTASQSRFHKKSVVFGSPNAAEFHTKDPVLGGVTPLAKTYARTRFRMEDHAPPNDALVEEDEEGDTALNSSILATWENEESSRRSLKGGSSTSKNKSVSGKSSSGSSRRKARRQSNVYEPGSVSGDDLVGAFDQVAAEEERALRKKKDEGPAANSEGETVDLKTISDLVQVSPSKEGDTVEFSALEGLTSDSPHSLRSKQNGSIGGDTIDLKELESLTTDTTSSPQKSFGSRLSQGERIEDGNLTMDVEGMSNILNFSASNDEKHDDQMSDTGPNHDEHTVELGALSELCSFSPEKDVPMSATNQSKQDSNEEHTVELGTLSDLTNLDQSSMTIGVISSEQQPEGERTVELGQLSELAQLDDDEKVSTGGNQLLDTNESHTVDLGQLSELSQLSPGPTASPHIGNQSTVVSRLTPVSEGGTDDENSPSIGEEKLGRATTHANIRLSFSSLASSGTGQAGSSDDNVQGKVFDSAALLDQFVNSPDSSNGDGASTPSKNRSLDDSILTPASQSSEAFKTKSKMARTPEHQQIKQQGSTPGNSNDNGQDENILEMESDSNDDKKQNAKDSVDKSYKEDTFTENAVKNNAKNVEESNEKDNEVDSNTEKDLQVQPIPTNVFLDKFGLGLNLSNLSPNLEPEATLHQLVAEPDIDLFDVNKEKLEKACVFTADMYHLTWAVNELCNRTSVTERTIEHISSGLTKNNPPLFLQDIESAKERMKQLCRAATSESQLAWIDFCRKSMNLSIQAAKEHSEILREDNVILEQGISRLQDASRQVKETIEARKRLSSLVEAQEEQRSVVEMYTGNVENLEAKLALLKDQKEEYQVKVDAQEEELAKAKQVEAERKAFAEMSVDLEGRNAILEVAQGLHVWRLHHVASSLVVLAIEHASGASELISFSFDGETTPCIADIVVSSSEAPTDRVEEENMHDLVREIEAITRKRINSTVAQLHRTLAGDKPSKIPEILRSLDTEFGRLEDLWDEVRRISASTGTCFALTLGAHDRIVLSTELLHHKAGKVVKADFEIRTGYPLAQKSCNAIFTTSGSSADDSTLLDQVQKVSSTAINESQFTPLTAAWEALQPIFF